MFGNRWTEVGFLVRTAENKDVGIHQMDLAFFFNSYTKPEIIKLLSACLSSLLSDLICSFKNFHSLFIKF